MVVLWEGVALNSAGRESLVGEGGYGVITDASLPKPMGRESGEWEESSLVPGRDSMEVQEWMFRPFACAPFGQPGKNKEPSLPYSSTAAGRSS